MENPVQLRLGFTSPTTDQRWVTGLVGTQVSVAPQDGDVDLVLAYLSSIGVQGQRVSDDHVSVAVTDLRRFLTLPENVTIIPLAPLRVLLSLMERPPHTEQPVVVTSERSGGFNLAWFDGRIALNEQLTVEAAPAFITLEIPFVASSDTWDDLLSASQMPVLLGRARVNLDGFVEVVTSKPQKVEASPVRALFKLDDSHYGVPLMYADDLSNAPGFVWEGRRPSYDQAPQTMPDLGVKLSDHASSDLKNLVGRLAASRAEAIVWEGGLGRRVFALAALTALDAFPLLLVTPPQNLWAWQRHLDLLGKTWSLTHDRADVQIITYRDLATRRVLSSPASLILDDLDRVPTDHLEALRRLDGVLDAYRIGCCSTFPEDPADGVRLMSALRPAEFRADAPLLTRYPMRPEVRAREHVNAYVSRRAQDGSTHGFRRSSVELLEPTAEQVKAVEAALDVSVRPMSDALAEGLQVVSAGAGSSTGPKIARAVELARDAVREDAAVALVTRHSRTAQMIRIAMRPLEVEVVEHYDRLLRPEAGKVVVVVRPDGRLPDLKGFERVVLLDYMWSSLALESAVGSAADESGPLSVVQLHLRIPLDDRCALLAARRRELGPVLDPYGSPTTEDHAFLLSDRR